VGAATTLMYAAFQYLFTIIQYEELPDNLPIFSTKASALCCNPPSAAQVLSFSLPNFQLCKRCWLLPMVRAIDTPWLFKSVWDGWV